MSDDDGQIFPAHSISAGLDYPGVGPEHAHLKDTGRAEYIAADDSEALDSFLYLSKLEGIIPALESSHAVAGARKLAPGLPADSIIVVNLSGRGDKDVMEVRDILEKGAQWFASQGRNGGKGLRSYSVSGRVREPGVKLAPAGVSARELIDEFCGGMAEGHSFKGYLPGGASGGILPASMADLPLEFGSLEKHGCFVGSHAVVILSDKDSARDAALNLMRFFEDESCGQCAPCRIGSRYLHEALTRSIESGSGSKTTLANVADAAWQMNEGSICGLGQAAGLPLTTAMKYFGDDFA